MTISETQRRQTEERIRAATDRLLRGQIPPGGGCDVQTLAIEAGVSRAALYRTYLHLKNEFEQRLARLRAEGQLPDPRAAQIIRLKDDNAKLRQRVTAREQEIADLSAFKTTALSRLAAQHQEITALRAALASRTQRPDSPGHTQAPGQQAVIPITLLPPNVRHTGPAQVTVGPSAHGLRSAVSGLFISTQTMISALLFAPPGSHRA